MLKAMRQHVGLRVWVLLHACENCQNALCMLRFAHSTSCWQAAPGSLDVLTVKLRSSLLAAMPRFHAFGECE
jgi:hypothetical protein